MITEQTKKEILIINQLFKNNNIKINFKGVKNTPFNKNIICTLELETIKNINKLKNIFKSLELLLNTSINYLLDKESLIIQLKQKNQKIIYFENIIFSNVPKNENLIFLGVDDEQKPIFKKIDFLKSCLIGGTSGAGKSNLLHNIILSYLLLNDYNYLFLIDPKFTELHFYNKSILKNRLPLTVGHEKKDNLNIINSFINLIKKRFQKMQKLNQQTSNEPTALLIIDEYAALFNTTKEKNIINEKIAFISSIGRAANCFLILTTQHPTNANINNTIRSNLQTRICLHCESVQQSNNIINNSDGVKIQNKGEFIIKFDNGTSEHLQTPFIKNELIMKILKS